MRAWHFHPGAHAYSYTCTSGLENVFGAELAKMLTSTPKSEKWIARVREEGEAPIGFVLDPFETRECCKSKLLDRARAAGKLLPVPYVADGGGGGGANETEFGRSPPPARPVDVFFRGTAGSSPLRARLARVFAAAGNAAPGLAFDVSATAGLAPGHEGDAVRANVAAMARAKFCLVPRGKTPTSRRFFEAVLAGCVPVLLSDDAAIPFESVVDVDAFAVRICEAGASHAPAILAGMIASGEYGRRWRALQRARPLFSFSSGARVPDAPHMMLAQWALAARGGALMAEAEDFGSSGGNECDRKAKAAEWRRKTQTGGSAKAIGGLGRAKLWTDQGG